MVELEELELAEDDDEAEAEDDESPESHADMPRHRPATHTMETMRAIA